MSLFSEVGDKNKTGAPCGVAAEMCKGASADQSKKSLAMKWRG